MNNPKATGKNDFVHLHVHSHYSIMDAVPYVESIVDAGFSGFFGSDLRKSSSKAEITAKSGNYFLLERRFWG